MHNSMAAALKLLAACAMMLAMMGVMSPTTTAQTLCANEPMLGLVDSNGDGVASVGEIRSLAPDNAELQSAASQLEAQGYSGIAYGGGCGDGGSGNGNGSGNGSGSDTGNGSGNSGGGGNTGNGSGTGNTSGESGSGSGDSTASGAGSDEGANAFTGGGDGTGNANLSGSGAIGSDEGTGGSSVTSVPGTGTGTTAEQGQSVAMYVLAAVAAFALAGSLALRMRRVA